MVMLKKVRQVVGREPSRVVLPEDGRRAAVAAILTGRRELLFMRRAEYEGDPWSGHLSFPGGRVEPGETPLEAAIRETEEELGLALSEEQLLGELDELRTRGDLPTLVIRPYVFFVEEVGPLDTNEEVAAVHRLSLQALLDGKGRGTMRHPWRGHELVLPRVDFDGVRLWGLTLHMVDDLLHRLDGLGRGLERPHEGAHAAGRTPWEERA